MFSQNVGINFVVCFGDYLQPRCIANASANKLCVCVNSIAIVVTCDINSRAIEIKQLPCYIRYSSFRYKEHQVSQYCSLTGADRRKRGCYVISDITLHQNATPCTPAELREIKITSSTIRQQKLFPVNLTLNVTETMCQRYR